MSDTPEHNVGTPTPSGGYQPASAVTVLHEGQGSARAVSDPRNDPRLVGTPIYAPAPPAITVASVAPTSGTRGTPITLTGTALTGTTAVNIGGRKCTAVVVVNATTVTATTPAGTGYQRLAPGTYPVQVTVGGNVVTGPAFTVT